MTERRIEIVAFERERIIRRPAQMRCPICERNSEFLTARQASVLRSGHKQEHLSLGGVGQFARHQDRRRRASHLSPLAVSPD